MRECMILSDIVCSQFLLKAQGKVDKCVPGNHMVVGNNTSNNTVVRVACDPTGRYDGL